MKDNLPEIVVFDHGIRLAVMWYVIAFVVAIGIRSAGSYLDVSPEIVRGIALLALIPWGKAVWVFVSALRKYESERKHRLAWEEAHRKTKNLFREMDADEVGDALRVWNSLVYPTLPHSDYVLQKFTGASESD